MSQLLDDITYVVKTLCDNELDDFAILNMFFAKFGSVMACKNILTDSCRHNKPYPIAYYALNLLPSGGNKTKPYSIIAGFYDWLDKEYELKNELNKANYIEENIQGLSDKEKVKKIKELDKEASNLFCIKQNTNGATAQRLYLTAQAIQYMEFGSLFFYDTEFFEKFEKLNQKGNYDNVLTLIYNLYDGNLDIVSTALTNRIETNSISCSVCFASAYSKLMRENKLFNRFKEYLCGGFARRIFLYISEENNNSRINTLLPSLDDIYTAKNKIPSIKTQLKELYNSVIEKGIYKFNKEADKLIIDYHKNIKEVSRNIFNYTSTLPIEDEILKVELEGSTWKIVKLAFILHLLEEPSSLIVQVKSVEQAIGIYQKSAKYLENLLNKKALDEDDKIAIFINKNLNKEIDMNNQFKKLFNNTIKHNWKKFKEGELVELLNNLETNNIFYCIRKVGKKEYIKFYLKSQSDDNLTEL